MAVARCPVLPAPDRLGPHRASSSPDQCCRPHYVTLLFSLNTVTLRIDCPHEESEVRVRSELQVAKAGHEEADGKARKAAQLLALLQRKLREASGSAAASAAKLEEALAAKGEAEEREAALAAETDSLLDKNRSDSAEVRRRQPQDESAASNGCEETASNGMKGEEEANTVV